MEVILQTVGTGNDSELPIFSFTFYHKENKTESPYDDLEYEKHWQSSKNSHKIGCSVMAYLEILLETED